MTLEEMIAWAASRGACDQGLRWARSHTAIADALADPSGAEWRHHLASNSATHSAILSALVEDADVGIRSALVANPSTPEDIRRHLYSIDGGYPDPSSNAMASRPRQSYSHSTETSGFAFINDASVDYARQLTGLISSNPGPRNVAVSADTIVHPGVDRTEGGGTTDSSGLFKKKRHRIDCDGRVTITRCGTITVGGQPVPQAMAG